MPSRSPSLHARVCLLFLGIRFFISASLLSYLLPVQKGIHAALINSALSPFDRVLMDTVNADVHINQVVVNIYDVFIVDVVHFHKLGEHRCW